MKLYEINNEIFNILNSVDEETGEISDDQFNQLAELQLAREEKIENTALYLKNVKAEIEAVKAEKDKFAKRQKALENNFENGKNYLKYELHGEKYKSVKNNIYYGSSESVEITDTELVPENYLIPQEPKIDRNAIKKALKAGENINGAELKKSEYIVIR